MPDISVRPCLGTPSALRFDLEVDGRWEADPRAALDCPRPADALFEALSVPVGARPLDELRFEDPLRGPRAPRPRGADMKSEDLRRRELLKPEVHQILTLEVTINEQCITSDAGSEEEADREC